MENIIQKNNAVSTKNTLASKSSTLAALSLPALLLTFGLSTSDMPDADVIVAGGTEAPVAEIAATQPCSNCPPLCFIAE